METKNYDSFEWNDEKIIFKLRSEYYATKENEQITVIDGVTVFVDSILEMASILANTHFKKKATPDHVLKIYEFMIDRIKNYDLYKEMLEKIENEYLEENKDD